MTVRTAFAMVASSAQVGLGRSRTDRPMLPMKEEGGSHHETHTETGRGVCRCAVRAARRAFTLAELLVAMAIIGIIATVTVIAVGKISQDARVSSGINAITAGLDNARALAMKEGKLVALVLRPHRDGTKQHLELILCEWTGESFVNGNDYRPGVDRFVPIKNISARKLPDGISVAAPQYYASGPIAGGLTADFLWTTQVNLAVSGNGNAGEGRGSILAVMFDGTGTVVTDNQATDSIRVWVDFDDDGIQEDGAIGYDNFNVFPNVEYFDQTFEEDEPYVTHAVFVAVYDDQFVRELKTQDWSTDIQYTQELLGPEGLITTYSDRLYFNRFTGVVMR